MSARLAFAAALLLAFGAHASAAPPSARDEALRLAPPDAALVVVVQNLRDHLKAVGESPFAAWFPSSALGKQLLGAQSFKSFTDGATPVFGALGLTPAELFQDILGDAAVFAYTPATAADPKGERSVILVRPRKPDRLAAVVERLNAIQTKSGELTGVAERKHAGAAYFERRKADGPSDFYCFAGAVFAFSQSEADVRAALDRAGEAKDKAPELSARLTTLGVADAAAVVLLNPRPLDAEFAARVKAAPADERAFLAHVAEAWAALDAAALHLNLGADAELGVSLHFAPDRLPPSLKGWLVGPRSPSALWAAVPNDALFAAAGRAKPADVLDVLALLSPADAKPGAREAVEQSLGPVVGRDKLPLVLDALGPDWGVWVVPPAKGAAVPAVVAAVKVDSAGPKGAEAGKALTQALEYGFQVGRIAYNARHKDQLALKEESAGGAAVWSLSGEGLPAGFAPSFALKGGYLLLSTSPDAIKSFRPPTGEPKPGGEVPLARLNARGVREYLTARGPELARVLAGAGAGDPKVLAEEFGTLAQALEPLDAVELLARGDDRGLRVVLRAKPVQPLKK